MHNLEDQLPTILKEVHLLKRRVHGRGITIGKYAFDSLS